MAVHLFSHNEEAYERLEHMLAEKGKAAVIHPTGTGKSFIGFRFCQEHPQAKICWFSPSEYIFESQIDNLKAASGEDCPANIVFVTYARLMNMSDEEIGALEPDYLILDEFHRCGARRWGEGVKALISRFPDAGVIGFSATPIRYLDNGRDMVQELFERDGEACVAGEMTLGEAIVRGILPSPQYVTTVYQIQQDVDRLKKRIDALPAGLRSQSRVHYEALRRSLEQAEGIESIFERYMTEKSGKYIIFCSDWKHVNALREHTAHWFSGVAEQMNIYTLYSGEPQTKLEYAAFCEDDSERLKILLCIDSLNEGVHIEGISGVILFRPTVSPIIYKQQIGRALTSANREKPLIIDVVNNLDNLRSIDTIRSEMTNAVQALRESGKEALIQTDSFHVYEQAKDCEACFRRLESSLNCVWDRYYCAAETYYAQQGNLLVPRRYVTPEGIQLGAWITTQRAIYADPRKGYITPEQIERLNRIGMKWENRMDAAWENGFEHARAYYEEHHDLLVADRYVSQDGYPLGRWIAYLRNRRKKAESGDLDKERIARLDAIGMRWDAFDAKWEKRFVQALKYYQAHGDLKLPAAYRAEDGFCLGMWIVNQRKARRLDELSEEQIRRLEAIGMQWDAVYSKQWQSAYGEAKRYYEVNGDLNVPYAYCTASGFQLGKWISRQRSAKLAPRSNSNTKMTVERARQLEQIGMRWSV